MSRVDDAIARVLALVVAPFGAQRQRRLWPQPPVDYAGLRQQATDLARRQRVAADRATMRLAAESRILSRDA